MITFLLSNDYQQTARCLDLTRLSRQIVDCIHILRCLEAYNLLEEEFPQIPMGIIFSPIVKLWSLGGRDKCNDRHRTLIPELYQYFLTLNQEWIRVKGKAHLSYVKFAIPKNNREPMKLQWPEEVLNSHRVKLYWKDPAYYASVYAREEIEFTNVEKYVWENPRLQEKLK